VHITLFSVVKPKRLLRKASRNGCFFLFYKKLYIFDPPNQLLMNTSNFNVTTDLHASKGQRIGNTISAVKLGK